MKIRFSPIYKTGGILAVAALLSTACQSHVDWELAEQRIARYESEASQNEQISARAGGELTLHDYVLHGLQESPGLRGAFETWRAALERIPQVTALPDPKLSWTYFIEELQTRTGPQKNRYGVSQMIPWFRKLQLRGDVAGREAEALWWSFEAERLETTRRIERAYHEYAFLAQAIRITEENLALLLRLEPIVQRKFQTGARQNDLLRLQVEIGKVENEVVSLRDFRPALSDQLRAVTNFGAGGASLEPLPWPTPEAMRNEEFSIQELRKSLEQLNPRLTGLRQKVSKAEAARKLASQDRYPDLTLGLQYFDTEDAIMPGVAGSGDDPIAVTLSFNLPIWLYKYRAGEREADHKAEASRANLQRTRLDLDAKLAMALYDLDNSKRNANLHKNTLIPRARQTLEVTQVSYESGQATLLDLIDSERVLLSFEKLYWRAVANHGKAFADLSALTGDALTGGALSVAELKGGSSE